MYKSAYISIIGNDRQYKGLVQHQYYTNLESSKECSEDIDLYGLLTGGLGLLYALPEVSEQLETMLWSYGWKRLAKENYSTVNDSHSERKGTGKLCTL